MHRATDQSPYYIVFGKEPNKENHDTQANDQVPEGGNFTMNETKGKEQTESDNGRSREINKPLDLNISVEKDYTEAGEAKRKAE